MKIRASRNRVHITVNPRAIGDGLVIKQGTSLLLLSRDEWQELCEAGDKILSEHPAKPRRYRMA